jgi:hypothetical protein
MSDTPECMRDLVEELETRFEYVVTLMREGPDNIDEVDGKGAFAFVLGTDSENALVIEGGSSGDGREVAAVVWGVRQGARERLAMFEMNEQLFISLNIAD